MTVSMPFVPGDLLDAIRRAVKDARRRSPLEDDARKRSSGDDAREMHANLGRFDSTRDTWAFSGICEQAGDGKHLEPASVPSTAEVRKP